jgi:hypothetical protein
MIPRTRAIDTLVIQVSSSGHVVTEALRYAKNQCSDVVEWRAWNQVTRACRHLADSQAWLELLPDAADLG